VYLLPLITNSPLLFPVTVFPSERVIISFGASITVGDGEFRETSVLPLTTNFPLLFAVTTIPPGRVMMASGAAVLIGIEASGEDGGTFDSSVTTKPADPTPVTSAPPATSFPPLTDSLTEIEFLEIPFKPSTAVCNTTPGATVVVGQKIYESCVTVIPPTTAGWACTSLK
jgi:hypothetical protein